MASIIATAKVIPQTMGFHFKTLAPSNIPNGMRLKAAKILFIIKPNLTMLANINPQRSVGFGFMNGMRLRKNRASTIFTNGPTIDIFPFCSL